ncbi:MAG: permease-like cell division protein FtsX [Patescibacteria group bacterium]
MWRQTIRRIFNTGWTNFKRNSYVTIGTTGVMTLVLLLFLGLLALNFISDTIIQSLNEKVDITVYFKTTAAEEEMISVQDDLKNFSAVKSVEYVSRDQALEDFKVRHAGNALINESLAELEGNPLQASLNVKANNTSEYAAIANSLEGNKFRSSIDKINFYENEQVIGRIEKISNGLRNWGLVATLMLSVIAVLVTFNTIRLTIYNQKQEIEIMRLVGGSNHHISMPYLVEGALYGLFAGFLALIIFYPAVYSVSPKVARLMPGVNTFSYFKANAWQFIIIIFGAGTILGMVSSLVAIRRFLKI